MRGCDGEATTADTVGETIGLVSTVVAAFGVAIDSVAVTACAVLLVVKGNLSFIAWLMLCLVARVAAVAVTGVADSEGTGFVMGLGTDNDCSDLLFVLCITTKEDGFALDNKAKFVPLALRTSFAAAICLGVGFGVVLAAPIDLVGV